MLISEPYKRRLLRTGMEGGSTRQAITKAEIQELVVSYPATLEEQETLVARIEEVLTETQDLEAIAHRKLAALDALKQSLLHQAFTGEL
jgi:type I restriction enzyme S subunit